MFSLNNREGTRYKEKKNGHEKEYYSLRELVPYITGVNERNESFESKYKEIQRIIGAFRKSIGQNGSKIKIASYEKNMIVEATSNFYKNDHAREIIRKLNKEQNLTLEEHDTLINIFVEPMFKYGTEDEKKILVQYLKEMKADEYFHKEEIIENQVIKDVNLADEVKNYEAKLIYLDEYKKVLDNALEDWRAKVRLHILSQETYEREIKEHPEYLLDESYSKGKLPPELIASIAKDIVLAGLKNKKR